jgi:hypothetical protein
LRFGGLAQFLANRVEIEALLGAGHRGRPIYDYLAGKGSLSLGYSQFMRYLSAYCSELDPGGSTGQTAPGGSPGSTQRHQTTSTGGFDHSAKPKNIHNLFNGD